MGDNENCNKKEKEIPTGLLIKVLGYAKWEKMLLNAVNSRGVLRQYRGS